MRTSAFTLIELMIVIVIIGIAAGLVLPGFQQSTDTQLRAAAQILVADLEYAQTESRVHGDDLRLVVFDPAAGSYFLAASSAPATPIAHPIDKKPYRIRWGQGRAHRLADVTLGGLSLGGDDQVKFGVYGQLDQTTDGLIRLAAGPRSIEITLDAISGAASIGPVQ